MDVKLDIVRELFLVSRYGSLYNKVSVINAESLVYVKILVSVQACMIDNDQIYTLLYVFWRPHKINHSEGDTISLSQTLLPTVVCSIVDKGC